MKYAFVLHTLAASLPLIVDFEECMGTDFCRSKESKKYRRLRGARGIPRYKRLSKFSG